MHLKIKKSCIDKSYFGSIILVIIAIKMSVAEFLKGLPSFDENNFTKFHVDNNNRSPLKRPTVYVPTKEYPSEQVIVTEKTSILLRYLHQHWEKKNLQKKRDHTAIDITDEQIQARKRPRIEYGNTS